jgi:hypothetical protein
MHDTNAKKFNFCEKFKILLNIQLIDKNENIFLFFSFSLFSSFSKEIKEIQKKKEIHFHH